MVSSLPHCLCSPLPGGSDHPRGLPFPERVTGEDLGQWRIQLGDGYTCLGVMFCCVTKVLQAQRFCLRYRIIFPDVLVYNISPQILPNSDLISTSLELQQCKRMLSCHHLSIPKTKLILFPSIPDFALLQGKYIISHSKKFRGRPALGLVHSTAK